eukprot:TRINITY_DN5373_c0_g1_i5.p1 TRINITY_DN5373_c0_g1~~TRINITY_DN5373_c0_g1_i5.p1  ORF type:complete len:442 (+),score=101.05 TRINITY_DN5373_c0_g1_i5:947-2272(+)
MSSRLVPTIITVCDLPWMARKVHAQDNLGLMYMLTAKGTVVIVNESSLPTPSGQIPPDTDLPTLEPTLLPATYAPSPIPTTTAPPLLEPTLVPTPHPAAVPTPHPTPSPSSSPMLAVYVVPAVAGCVCLMCVCVVVGLRTRRRLRFAVDAAHTEELGVPLNTARPHGGLTSTPGSTISLDSLTFRVDELLGRGAYSSVYKATTEQGTAVAVKVIPLGDADDPLEEVAILRRVQHRHLVKFHDAEVKDKVLYITMEYLPNGTLAALVAREKMLSRRVARRYTRELISAVVYLHSIKIMHRDIKGENILLSEEGEVRLSDLGCSKVVAEVTKTVQPGAKTVVGTPRWMAPEVIMCTEVGYTNKADVWSVGCTVCEMLTGAPPWPCLATVWSTMYHIAHNDPDIPGYLDEATAGFLRMLLQKDPEGRPTAAEVEAHPWVVDENS